MHQPSSFAAKYGNTTQSSTTRVRPRSSPGIRSVSGRDNTGQQLQQPSYQERRQRRHGNTKLSRPTTAYLPKESATYIRSPSAWTDMTPALNKLQIAEDNTRGKTKPATTSPVTPETRAILRPHTAVKIHQRLRQLAADNKRRIRSACPRSNYSDDSDLESADDELLLERRRRPSPNSPGRKIEDGTVVVKATPATPRTEDDHKPRKKTTHIYGWNSSKVSSLTPSSTPVGTSGNNEKSVSFSKMDSDPPKSPLSRGSLQPTDISEPQPPSSSSSDLPMSNSSKPSTASSHPALLSKTLKLRSENKSIGSVSDSSDQDLQSTTVYNPPVPELKLGNAAVSIALNVGIKKRHRKKSRSAIYLQTAARRKGESAFQKWRRISKTIRVIAGICLAMKSYVKEGKTKQWSLVEMQLNLKDDMEKALHFDPLMFSNLHVSRGSHKLKIILSKLPSHRTTKDIEVVLALLRKNRTFANYHRDTQAKLAKVMEYQRFEARRIVLKEGHTASCFYIIISGICLVNQLDFDKRNNSQFVTTVKEIAGGDGFGEVALLTDTDREFSIICKEEVELLLINKEDFISIIRTPMENEQKELIKYCVKHEVFTDEMFDNIKSNYKTIMTQYYKPGTIITKDVNASEYIYVIKLGNVRVLSEVREYPNDKRKKSTMEDDTWKKHAAIKRSMSLIDSGKHRRMGWAVNARKQLNEKSRSSTLLKTDARPSVMTRSQSVSNDFSHVPARDFLVAHLQKDTKVADKKAVARAWKRVTVAASSASEKQRQLNEEAELRSATPGNRVKITYAKVANLTSGAVCGMETLLSTLQPDTRLCIASDGADCILVSKKIYNCVKNTTKTVEVANRMGTEYPSCEDQLQKIKQARTWAAYKNDIVGDVIYRKDASRGKVL